MRGYLLFSPLVPIAFLIYFAIRRFFPKADPEEIYIWLRATQLLNCGSTGAANKAR